MKEAIFGVPLKFTIVQILSKKMGDELATLMDLYHSVKKAGRSAALAMSSKGGKATIVKLEFELDDAKPSSPSTAPASSTSSPSLPGCQAAAAGDCHRHRGSGARRANASIGLSRLCPSLGVTTVLHWALLIFLHPNLDDHSIFIPLQRRRIAASF